MIKNYIKFIALTIAVAFSCSVNAQADCSSPVDVSAGGTFPSGTIAGTLEDFCGAGSGPTAGNWFIYTATATGNLTVQNCAAGADSQLGIATGTCGSLASVPFGCSDDDCGLQSSATVAVVSGTSYYIQWTDGWSTTGFNFNVSFALPPPPAEPCATAIDVSAEGTFTTPAITATLEDFCGAGSGPTAGNWYVYNATVAGNLTVENCGSTVDSQLGIATGTCGTLASVPFGCSDDDCGLRSSATVAVVPGTSYYIQWTDGWSASGFDFNVSFALPPPAAEPCATAIDVSALGTFTTPAISATLEDFCGASSGPTAGNWYVYNATVAGDLTVENCGSTVDSQLGIATGTCGSLTSVVNGCSDDDCGLQSSATVSVVPGTSYYIQWTDGWSTNGFDFNVSFVVPPPPPAFDTCANAIMLTVNTDGTCNITETFDNSYATYSAAEGAVSAGCAGIAVDPLDVWFSAVVPVGEEIAFTFLSVPGASSTVELYTGTCGSLVALAPVNCTNTGSRTFSGLTAGSTVYFRVWDFNSDDFGSSEVCLQGLNCLPAAVSSVDAVPDCANNQFSLDITTTTMGSSGPMAVVEDASGDTLGFINSVGTQNFGAFASGTIVDLTIHHTLSSDCNLTGTGFTYSCPPVNDECSDAIVVYSGYTVTGFSTVGATGTDITSCTFQDSASVWFEYTPTCATTVEINSCGSTYDTNISVWDDCLGTTELACNDDAPASNYCGGGFTLQSFVSFAAAANVTYYIRVAGFNGATGDINFSVVETVACPCVNNVWLGTTDSDWSEDTNWSCGTAPTSGCNGTTDNAIIPAGSASIPVVTGTMGVGDLEVGVGSSIDVGGVLEVCGNVDHSGATTGGGSVLLNGAVAQTITGSGTFENLELDNAMGGNAMAAADISISNSLVLTTGTFTNAGSVTLASDAAGTAYLDDFTPTSLGSYVGDITVERFVTPGSGLGQRYFGSAVSGGNVVGLDNQYTGYPLGQIIPDACKPNIVDQNSPYSNLFEWHEDATFATSCIQEGWFAISAGTALTSGRGYSGWMNDGSTLSVTGAPNTGAVSYGPLSNTASGVVAAQGWHLLSNPYPSPMNIDAAYSSGFSSPQYYNAASGAFSGTFQPVIIAGSEVPVMQGFVAQTAGGSTFAPTDADRVASNNANFFKSNDWYDYKLDIQVMVDGKADMTYLFYSDVNTPQFDNTSDCIKRHSDSDKPTLYTKMGSDELSLNGLHLNDLGTSIPLGLIAGEDGDYSFTFSGGETFPANTTIYLEDRLTGEYHNIEEGMFKFQGLVSENGMDRFLIHFVLPAAFNLIDPTCENTNGIVELLTTDNRVYKMSLDGNYVENGVLDGSNISLSHGDYSITVFDQYNGSQLYNVSIPEVITVNTEIINTATIIETNESIDFEYNGQGASTFEWFVNGNSVATTQMFEYEFTQAGEYVVELVASNSSCSDSKQVTITVNEKSITSIIDLGNNSSLSIYGENGNVMVEFSNVKESNAEVSVFNLIGQNMINKVVETNGVQVIPNQNWASSYYLVKVSINDEVYNATVLLTK